MSALQRRALLRPNTFPARNSEIAGILGAGVQARLQLKALTLVRPISEARIWARDNDKSRLAARELSEELGIAVTAGRSPEDVVRGADIVVTTTPSPKPILHRDWLEPGQHITAMGSDAEHKNELDPAIVTGADLYVADSVEQTRRLGELHHAIEAGLVQRRYPVPGSSVRSMAGTTPGRSSPGAITVADLTGTGVQDTAIATLARDRARLAKAGSNFES